MSQYRHCLQILTGVPTEISYITYILHFWYFQN